VGSQGLAVAACWWQGIADCWQRWRLFSPLVALAVPGLDPSSPDAPGDVLPPKLPQMRSGIGISDDVLPNAPSAVIRVSALRSGARAGVVR
jgi:hypothetical protein